MSYELPPKIQLMVKKNPPEQKFRGGTSLNSCIYHQEHFWFSLKDSLKISSSFTFCLAIMTQLPLIA